MKLRNEKPKSNVKACFREIQRAAGLEPRSLAPFRRSRKKEEKRNKV